MHKNGDCSIHHLPYVVPIKNSNEDFLEPHFSLNYLVFKTKESLQFPQSSVEEIGKQMLLGIGEWLKLKITPNHAHGQYSI